ncbi:MAG: serine/threonine-protein kinase [Gemmatimonadales bacterium]
MPDPQCPTCQTPVPAGALYCSTCGSRTGAGPAGPTAALAVDVVDRLSRALGAKYQVRRLLGEGGFAQVYEVWDTDLERKLAVKVLKPDVAWSAGMLERFRQETRSIARLAHPNILPIHFVGEGEGLTYYAMPFVEGESLAALLRRQGALTPERAIALLKPLLEALSHAHGQGLIHRDIKPDNIMIEASSGRPLLVDFGIAKRLDGAGHQTQTGFVVGTPQYMSPEQALGQGDVDARSDLYAVGAVLYQMVTGAPPFEGESSQEIVGKHLSEPAPIASASDARIPRWLSDLIVRCLAKRPAERYQSAAMILDALAVGRLSGAQDAVSAGRVARQLGSEEATMQMPSTERSVAKGTARPLRGPAAGAEKTAVTPAITPPASPTRLPWLLVLLPVLAAVAWVVVPRSATLVVENRLVEPVRFSVGGKQIEIAAGSTVREKIPGGTPFAAPWYLVRPSGPAGEPLGVALQGTLSESAPKGEVRRVIDARSASEPVFAPLITNTTDEALAIVINAGSAKAAICACRVNPGAVRARIGYYPLFLNSAVQARTPAGGSATFRELGGAVDRATGSVGLKFEAKDF